MSYAAARPLDPWRWIALPMAVALAMTVLLATPLRLWGLRLPEPVFPLVLVFSWVVIRPSILAPFAVLAMGLFLDLYWAAPMGFWALAMLIGYGAALSGRRMLVGQGGAVLWGWYAAICALVFGAGALFMIAQNQTTLDPVSLGWQYLATILLYPFAHRLIDRFEDADVRFR